MSAPYERFKNLAAGIQSSVFAIAIVVGGGWTLFRFVSLGEIERARRELFEQAELVIDLSARQELPSGESERRSVAIAGRVT